MASQFLPPMRRASVSGADGAQTQGSVDSVTATELQSQVPLDVVTPIGGSGLNINVRDAVLVVSRHEVVFALGKFAVLHNAQTQELVLIGGQQPSPVHGSNDGKRQQHSAELGEITALALCGKRHYLSICRAATSPAHGGATVSIHSLRGSSTVALAQSTKVRQQGSRQRILGVDNADRFSCTALSTDGKLVCCQCANSSWTIVVWDWNRERQIAVSDVHCKVTRVRFNVVDMAQISTSGGNQLKLWTLSEYTLKSFASFKSGDEIRTRHKVASYADHVWLPDDCLVALLEDGGVQLIINGELVQTVQALAEGIQALSITTQNNGEAGILVGGARGALASMRVVSKLMRSGEKELHLQRRMTVANASFIYTMGVDLTGSVLVCCTENFYGAYDLSNLCLLLNEDESLMLTPLSSTPFVTQVQPASLTISSRRPCFGVLTKLPDETDAILVWNQSDASDCVVAHVFDPHSAPQSIDFHPNGGEMAVAFQQKVVVFYILHDSLKVAFELPAKNASTVLYSPSGSHLIVARSSHHSLLVYRTTSYARREPELVAKYQGIEDCIECLTWSVLDTSFYYADNAGGKRELRHCRLFEGQSHGDVEDVISVHSRASVVTPGGSFVGMACSRFEHDSHDHVLFAVEKNGVPLHAAATRDTSTYLRAWLNSTLDRDALVTGHERAGLKLHHNVTAIASASGRVLLLGTSTGLVLLLYWKLGRLNGDGTRNVLVMANHSQADLHVSPVIGLRYSASSRTLLTSDASGVVLASAIRRGAVGGEGTDRPSRQSAIHDAKDSFDDGCVFQEPSQAFVCVCQPDEIAMFDRNAIELRRLRQLDLEGELQQVKMENELLSKQLNEQKQKMQDTISTELRRHDAQATSRQHALASDWEQRLDRLSRDKDHSVRTLQEDAQLARDQYVASTDRLTAECERLKHELTTAKQTIEDLKLSREEHESVLRVEFASSIQDEKKARADERQRLTQELETTKRQLREALEQHNQDQMTQLAMLSTSVDTEKSRAANQVSQIQGKMAALHQEVKMLLAALTQKDHDIQTLRDRRDRDLEEIASLKDQLRREKETMQQLTKDKHDLVVAANEQRLVRENLQRLNDVHRSQIEMLQKNLLPKQKELDQMQQHLNQLHHVNQEIVVQANVSDRLRKESGSRARQSEADVVETQGLLDHVRHSIVVLHDELGELVQQSAVQEKSAIVGEIMRIHKRITRQMDTLQAKDGRAEEVSAELHRQNKFLIKNKQHLRKQVEISYTEKHKLVSALSFQNSTLMNELNSARKQNKELERMVKQMEQRVQRLAVVSNDVTQREVEVPTELVDELDSRALLADSSTASSSVRPSSASARSRPPVIIPHANPTSHTRPKSAAPIRATRR